MNNKTKTPVFQSNQQKKFHERAVTKNTSKNAPNFKTPHSKSQPAQPQSFTTQISHSRMRAANGEEGKVKVMVKSTGASEKPAKKTGPLSPRAPEKIKKNRAQEMKVYGENACQALFTQRPESIVRVWATVEMAKKSGALFSYLAEHKKAYHVVDNAELTLVSGTEHHNGICMLVKKARPFTLSGYLDIPRKQDCLVLLDGVQNPHNLGGIIRTCAIFAVNGVVVEQQLSENLNTSSAMRIAEGGMEYVRVLETEDVHSALQKLRNAGYQVIHLTSPKQGKPLAKVKFSAKVLFVVSEQFTGDLAQSADDKVSLSAGNPLKAELNIAVATGILLSHWECQLN